MSLIMFAPFAYGTLQVCYLSRWRKCLGNWPVYRFIETSVSLLLGLLVVGQYVLYPGHVIARCRSFEKLLYLQLNNILDTMINQMMVIDNKPPH